MPSRPLKVRMGGIVASPTPIVPISSDSMRQISVLPCPRYRLSAAAAIHPAVPPPMMTIRSKRLGFMVRSHYPADDFQRYFVGQCVGPARQNTLSDQRCNPLVARKSVLVPC